MMCDDVVLWDVWLFSTRTSDRTQIWHACADRYSHLKKNKTFDPLHPGGDLGGYLLLKKIRDRPHPNLARMCG